MRRKEYFFEDKEAFKKENAIRKFILENADSLRLTLVEWSEGIGSGKSKEQYRVDDW